jgi:hypothetical protein
MRAPTFRAARFVAGLGRRDLPEVPQRPPRLLRQRQRLQRPLLDSAGSVPERQHGVCDGPAGPPHVRIDRLRDGVGVPSWHAAVGAEPVGERVRGQRSHRRLPGRRVPGRCEGFGMAPTASAMPPTIRATATRRRPCVCRDGLRPLLRRRGAAETAVPVLLASSSSRAAIPICRRTAACFAETRLRAANRQAVCFTDEAQSACDDIPCSTFTSGLGQQRLPPLQRRAPGLVLGRHDVRHAGVALLAGRRGDDGGADVPVDRVPQRERVPAERRFVAVRLGRESVRAEQRCARRAANPLPAACRATSSCSAGTAARASATTAPRRVHCDATGACVRSCANVPQQTRVETHFVRSHWLCPTGHVHGRGEFGGVVVSLLALLHQRHAQACPPGATCDVNGDCVFEGDGKGCTMDIQCASRFCVKGVCCNRACSNECEECLLGDGKCKARTGSACSFDVRCSQFVRGVSPSHSGAVPAILPPTARVCACRRACAATRQICALAVRARACKSAVLPAVPSQLRSADADDDR